MSLSFKVVETGLYVRRLGDTEPVCMFTGGNVAIVVEGSAKDLRDLANCINDVADNPDPVRVATAARTG